MQSSNKDFKRILGRNCGHLRKRSGHVSHLDVRLVPPQLSGQEEVNWTKIANGKGTSGMHVVCRSTDVEFPES